MSVSSVSFIDSFLPTPIVAPSLLVSTPSTPSPHRFLIAAAVVASFARRLPPQRRPRGIIHFGTYPTRGLHASRTPRPTYIFPCA